MSNLLANEMYLEPDADDGGRPETMSEVEKTGVDGNVGSDVEKTGIGGNASSDMEETGIAGEAEVNTETVGTDSNAGSDMAETMSPVSKKIVQALVNLSTRVQDVVIVTNDVFSDGGSLTYDESTREYVKNLAEINCALARVAETVTEVVCVIQVIVKKNHPMGK